MSHKDDYLAYPSRCGALNYILGSSESGSPNAMRTASSSGLADLEKAFGRDSQLMVKPPGGGDDCALVRQNNLTNNSPATDESDIDCEE